MLLDHDAGEWAAMIHAAQAEVGDCPATEPVQPVSAMEGHFTWACSHGRVQRAPTPAVTLQALDFAAAMP